MWKLKLDENGNVSLQDGKPVYVNETGEEKAYDMSQGMSKIAQLNGEAKAHREAKEAAEHRLEAFKGIDDPTKALEAMQKLGDLDAKKLIDAGEVEKVKAEMAKTFQSQIDDANSQTQALQQQLYEEKIGGSFARSAFIGEKLAIPSDVAQAFFGRHFSIDGGNIVAKDSAGNAIYSRNPDTAGNLASFDEALSILVSDYPNKDQILKSSGMSGSGEQSSSGGNHKNMKRSQMSAKEKSDFVAEHGHEAFLKLEK